MICMIDNYDSFTYNLVNYVRMQGEEVDVYRNDQPVGGIDFSRYVGIILSPGPSNPANAGITLDIIRLCTEKPILGVCLGMQSIAYVLGGSIVHAARIMHGKVDEISHSGGRLFEDIPERFSAVRYHSLAITREGLPAGLAIRAVSSDGEIMAVSHNTRFLWGVQFHPESCLTEHGHTLIKNFIGGCYEHR